MQALVIPEVILYDTINSVILMLKDDIKTHTGTPKKTILWSLLGMDGEGKPMKMNTFVHFDQAYKIFSQKDISINLGYNMETLATNLGIHIILPNENGRPLTIGADEGYEDTEDVDEQHLMAKLNKTLVMNSTYNILITSPNSAEVILVYNILRACMLVIVDHFEIAGLRNPNFNGNDVIIQQELIPAHIFHRSLNFGFDYEVIASNIFAQQIIKKFKYKAVILTN
jgi:hypothetical protein